jgi:hypothetical protein
MSDDNVIPFNFGSDFISQKEPPEGDERFERRLCRCKKLIIDDHERALYCASCGRHFDPFDHIMARVRESAAMVPELSHRKREGKKLRDELDDLKRKIRNAKAQLRRVEKAAKK